MAKIEKVHVTGAFLDTTTASAYLMDHEVDIISVDINMPRESGLEFAKELRKLDVQMKDVFITSHKKYVLSALDTETPLMIWVDGLTQIYEGSLLFTMKETAFLMLRKLA